MGLVLPECGDDPSVEMLEHPLRYGVAAAGSVMIGGCSLAGRSWSRYRGGGRNGALGDVGIAIGIILAGRVVAKVDKILNVQHLLAIVASVVIIIIIEVIR